MQEAFKEQGLFENRTSGFEDGFEEAQTLLKTSLRYQSVKSTTGKFVK